VHLPSQTQADRAAPHSPSEKGEAQATWSQGKTGEKGQRKKDTATFQSLSLQLFFRKPNRSKLTTIDNINKAYNHIHVYSILRITWPT